MNGADIQIDDGDYTRIHYAILEALAEARLSGAEFRILMFLFRKTYGWNKKEDRISLAQWAEGTNTARPHVLKILNGLVAKNIVIRRNDDEQVPWYSFNKYREQWQDAFEKDSVRGERFKVLPGQEPLPIQVTVTKAGNGTVTKAGNGSVTKAGTHNRQDRQIKDKVSALPKAAPTEQQAMFGAIAEVCRLDAKLRAKMIGQNAATLLKAGYAAEDVQRFAEWWQSDAWRREHKPTPRLKDLLDDIRVAQEWATRRNGNGPSKTAPVDRNDALDDPQIRFTRRMNGEI